MHSLFIFDAMEREIPADSLLEIFHSIPEVQRVRQDTPAGIPIEANYIDGPDFTTVCLGTERKAVSIRGTSGAALSAAWALKIRLPMAMRITDSVYTFDLLMSDFATIDELRAAMDQAYADGPG